MADELRIRLLGGLDVAGLAPRAVGSRKARTLLARLALARGEAVPLDAVATAVWAEALPAEPAAQLPVLVSRLRATLGSDRIERRDAGYLLHADWLDITALDELTEDAAARLRAGRATSARAAAAAALALVRGPLLPEEPDAEWATADRAACARQARRARRLLAEAALAVGSPSDAADAATAAVADDPYDEESVRLLLRACSAAGRVPAGLAAYERFRRLLDDELGVSPEPATEQVYLSLLRAEHTPAPRAPTASLPGRAAELAALEVALADSRSHARPVVVELTGEAGIGKSRLLDVFRHQALLGGVVLAAARCDELGRDLPLQPVLDAVAELLAGLEPDEREAVVAPHAELMSRLLGDPARSVVSADGEGLVQPVVFRALLDVVVRCASGRPAGIILDDVHLADRATLAWLAFVARAPVSPLLVVAARRAEEGASLFADRRVRLGALDENAVAELVGGERAAELHARTGGHPLFLAALADAPDGEVPESLRASIADRVRRAGPAATTLHAAAVLGPDVDVELLATLLDRPVPEVLDDLEEGQRRHLLDDNATTFAFVHALVREALVASMSASRRAWLHREAARILAERPAIDPLQLAYHARQAGDAVLTVRGLVAASDIAGARGDYDSAIELLDEAAPVAPSADVDRRRARVLLQLSRYDDARTAAARAIAAERNADSYEVLAQVSYYSDRDYLRAAELTRTAAGLASDPVQRLRALAFAGRCLHAEGRLRAADAALDEAEAEPLARALPDARLYRGALRAHQGRAADAVDLLAPPPATADTLAFLPVVGAMMRGLAFAQLGHVVEALAEFDRSEGLATARGLRRYGGRIDNCRGHVLRNLGRLDEARDCHRRALEAGAAVDQAEPQAHAWLDLADDALEREALDDAAVALDAAAGFATVPHSYRWRHLLRASLLRGRLALATGDPGTAADLAEEVLTAAIAEEVERYAVLGRLVHAQARHVAGLDVDREAVAEDLLRLRSCAGLDGWRVAQDCAATFDVAPWRAWADAHVRHLADAAVGWADDLGDYAARRADRTIIRAVHG